MKYIIYILLLFCLSCERHTSNEAIAAEYNRSAWVRVDSSTALNRNIKSETYILPTGDIPGMIPGGCIVRTISARNTGLEPRSISESSVFVPFCTKGNSKDLNLNSFKQPKDLNVGL